VADALTKKVLNRLGTFTSFLAGISGKTGFQGGAITEVGIPHARTDTSPPAAYVADVPLWQALYDAWYTAADDAGLTVVPWASGPGWGDYNLAMHTNDSSYLYPTGTNVDKFMSPGGIDVTEAHPVQTGATYRRGVNYAGLDFGHKTTLFTNANSGGLNDGTERQFFAPTAADVAVMAARQVRTIRLPVNWERLQPTLLGALDTTYLNYITTVADACLTNGIGLIIDLHNYARYEYNDSGTKKVLVLRYETGIDLANPGPQGDDAGKIGRDYLIDVWRRLSNVYRTHAGVVAYELMNEPHDVAPSAGSFSGTTLNDWNTGTIQSWSGGIGATLSHTTSTPYEGSGALRVSGTTGSAGAFFNLRAERGSVSGTGNVLRGRVRMNGSPTGTWQARFEWQNTSFDWQTGTLTTLTPGTWTEVSCDFAGNPIPGSALNLCIQVQCNSPAGSQAVSFDLDLFERGSLVGAYTDVQAWEQITQAVLTDLRSRPDDTTKRDTKTILVPGHGWNVLSWSHASAWITEPSGLEGSHRYVTHQYFDSTATGGGEGEGVYQTADKRYADAKTYAVSQGFTDDADTTAPSISSVSSGSPTTGGATITWTTGENADQRVEYGLNTLPAGVYGSSSLRGSTPSTSHSVSVTSLLSNATYRYRVRSRDVAGNLTVSSAGTFTTLGTVPFGGDWTVTDTGSHLSTVSGRLLFDGGIASPTWGDPGLVSAVGLARGTLGAFSVLVRLTNSSDDGPQISLSPSNTDPGATGSSAITFDYPDLLAGWKANVDRARSIDYLLTVVPRPEGGFWRFISGGEFGTFPTATLVGVSETETDATLYAHIANRNSVFYATNATFVPNASLPAALTTRYGPALGADDFASGASLSGRTTPYGAKAWSVATGSGTISSGRVAMASGLVAQFDAGAPVRMIEADITRTATSGARPMIYFRGDGTNSGSWRVKAEVDRVSIHSSAGFVDQTGAITFTQDVAYKLRVVDWGNHIEVFVNGTSWLQVNSTLGASNTRVGIGSENGTGNIDNFSAWGTTTLNTAFVAGMPVPKGLTADTVDAFTAADGTTLPAYSAAWAANSGTWHINTNRARMTAAGVNGIATRTVNGSNHEVKADIFLPSTTPAYPNDWFPAVFARYTDANNYVMARFLYQDSSNEVELWEVSASVSTLIGYINLGIGVLAPGSTHTLALAVQGNEAAAYLDNTLVVQATTSVPTGTRAGIGVQDNLPNGQPAWDNVTVSPTVAASARTVAASATLRTTATRTVSVSASLVAVSTRQVAATAAVRSTRTRLVSVVASFSIASTAYTRQLAANARLSLAGTIKAVQAFASITDPNDVGVPSAPASLAAVLVVGSQVTITWDDTSTDEHGFQIEWSENNQTWRVLTTLPAGSTQYTDTSLYPGSRRYYRVRAFRSV
jgi:hypothetical protein